MSLRRPGRSTPRAVSFRLGSLAVGVLAVFVRRGEAALTRRGTWVKVAAALAIILLGLGRPS
jgi:hypothetical protein